MPTNQNATNATETTEKSNLTDSEVKEKTETLLAFIADFYKPPKTNKLSFKVPLILGVEEVTNTGVLTLKFNRSVKLNEQSLISMIPH